MMKYEDIIKELAKKPKKNAYATVEKMVITVICGTMLLVGWAVWYMFIVMQ